MPKGSGVRKKKYDGPRMRRLQCDKTPGKTSWGNWAPGKEGNGSFRCSSCGSVTHEAK